MSYETLTFVYLGTTIFFVVLFVLACGQRDEWRLRAEILNRLQRDKENVKR